MFRLIEALEDLDDVQNVFANFDVPDDVLADARRLSEDGLCADARRRASQTAASAAATLDSQGRARACVSYAGRPRGAG